MDRTRPDEPGPGSELGVTDEAVLVCTTDGTLVRDLGRALPGVRTARTQDGAVDSVDESVLVVVVDVTDPAFEIEPFARLSDDRDRGLQVCGVVDDGPAPRVADRADATLARPVEGDAVRHAVNQLARRARYARALATYYELSAEYAAVKTADDADRSSVRGVQERLRSVRARLDELGSALDEDDVLEVALAEPSARG